MAEVLVTGKKISDMVLVSTIVGTEKIPTDVSGDKAVTTGQLLTYLDNNGRSGWGRIDGDIGLQTDLMNKFNQQDLELANHAGNTQNPHNVTKTQVGLGNVDNTSDANKPVSTATQTALDGVSENLSNHTGNQLNPHNVTKTQVGLGNVDDTSDINKPVSLATQTALDLKVNLELFNALNDFLERGNRYKYSTSLAPYSKGQIIQSDDETVEYLSLIDNNSVNPNSSPISGSWSIYSGQGSVPDATSSVKGIAKIIDNLTSTDPLSALSAGQGKVLQDSKLNTAQAFGVGQSHQDVTSSRLSGTTYTNNTGRPIEVCVYTNKNSGGTTLVVVVNGMTLFDILNDADGNQNSWVTFTVPDGNTYSVTSVAGGIASWKELR